MSNMTHLRVRRDLFMTGLLSLFFSPLALALYQNLGKNRAQESTPQPDSFAMRCSALQCVAVCCSVLQCVAQCVAVCCSVLQCVAVCCSVLQCVAEKTGYKNLFHSQTPACWTPPPIVGSTSREGFSTIILHE